MLLFAKLLTKIYNIYTTLLILFALLTTQYYYTVKYVLPQSLTELFCGLNLNFCGSELDAAATVHNNHSTSAPSAHFFQPSSSSGFFSNFELLSKDSVKKLVLSEPTKLCSLDPVPTKVVTECLDELMPLLTVIINQSLESGVFPDVRKERLL